MRWPRLRAAGCAVGSAQLRCALAALAAAACSAPPCRPSTLFLTVSFVDQVARAPFVEVILSLDGAPEQRTRVAHDPTHQADTLEIDVPNYHAGSSLAVRLDALIGPVRRGSGALTVTLPPTCARASLTVTAVSCPAIATGVALFVDPANGSDDAGYGAGAGLCAARTIGYALGVATGIITLAPGTYQAPVETLPFKLIGAQVLDCQQAAISGAGPFGVGGETATVILSGGDSGVRNCDLDGANRADACVYVSKPADTTGHVIENTHLSGCRGAAGQGAAIWIDASGDGITVRGSRIEDSFDGIRWSGDGHTGTMTGNTFATLDGADITCPDGANAAVTGSGNQHAARPCAGCAHCPF